MKIVGSTGKRRTNHLGPRYSAEENKDVDPSELLPIWMRLDFDEVPIDLQPAVVLKAYLLNHGVPTNENDSPDMMRNWVRQAVSVQKEVLHHW